MTTSDAKKRLAEAQAAAERPVLTLYIAGPMTGLPEFNYPAFFWAAGRLAESGIDTINPARAEGREDCTSWVDYMRASLRDLADCDGVATLQGWGDSRGAALEVHIARSLDLPIKPVGEWAEEYATTSPSPTKGVTT
jgi:hypothetical protein